MCESPMSDSGKACDTATRWGSVCSGAEDLDTRAAELAMGMVGTIRMVAFGLNDLAAERELQAFIRDCQERGVDPFDLDAVFSVADSALEKDSALEIG